MAKIAFLGLGVMGGPMAGHLAKQVTRFVYIIALQKKPNYGSRHMAVIMPIRLLELS